MVAVRILHPKLCLSVQIRFLKSHRTSLHDRHIVVLLLDTQFWHGTAPRAVSLGNPTFSSGGLAHPTKVTLLCCCSLLGKAGSKTASLFNLDREILMGAVQLFEMFLGIRPTTLRLLERVGRFLVVDISRKASSEPRGPEKAFGGWRLDWMLEAGLRHWEGGWPLSLLRWWW